MARSGWSEETTGTGFPTEKLITPDVPPPGAGVVTVATGARATGYCLTVQVLGQLGWMLSPLAVGALSAPLGGLGKAASLFAVGPLIGIVLILTMVPETRGKTLEELSPETAQPASRAL